MYAVVCVCMLVHHWLNDGAALSL